MPELLIVNTSNEGKRKEFTRLLKNNGYDKVLFSGIDVPEVDTEDPVEVAVQKAMLAAHAQVREGHPVVYGDSFEQRVVVEDTSLDIEGVDLGVNIRWLLESQPSQLEAYKGRPCVFRCIIAAMDKHGEIRYAKGEVRGVICLKSGSQGFGFDPYIIPNGSDKSLAEEKPDDYNARALALRDFCKHNVEIIRRNYREWTGAWQNGKAPKMASDHDELNTPNDDEDEQRDSTFSFSF